MQHFEQTANNDGQQTFLQEWKPEQAKGTIVLVHGLGEHSGRYGHVAKALTGAGYAVLSFDLPGHGRSGGLRGHVQSYQTVMDLITRRLGDAAGSYPEQKHFLYGHSLGGNLVLYYALTQRPDLDGIVVTSPGLGTAAPVPAWKLALGKVLYRIAPTVTLDNGLDVNGLCHNRAVIDAYQSDPMVHPMVSVRLGQDLLNNGQWILDHAAEFPPIPLLLMQGSADSIVDPQKTQAFAEKVPGNITFKMWDGLYHELHNEPENKEVFKEITDWLDRH